MDKYVFVVVFSAINNDEVELKGVYTDVEDAMEFCIKDAETFGYDIDPVRNQYITNGQIGGQYGVRFTSKYSHGRCEYIIAERKLVSW